MANMLASCLQWQLKYRQAIKTDHPPHIYAIGDWCFSNMLSSSQDQCCVVRYAYSPAIPYSHLLAACLHGTLPPALPPAVASQVPARPSLPSLSSATLLT